MKFTSYKLIHINISVLKYIVLYRAIPILLTAVVHKLRRADNGAYTQYTPEIKIEMKPCGDLRQY